MLVFYFSIINIFIDLILCLLSQNKYLFSYLSLLIQEDHFKVIEVYFLIVGHTHASIDQYFSVLARVIYYSKFIGSPLSLASLLSTEKDSKYSNENCLAPLLVRNIRVVYDMKSSLSPFINSFIKYYPIPHRYAYF